MFNIGFSEMLVIAIIAIIFVGPNRLPEFTRKFAKVLRQVKKSMNEIKYGLYYELDQDDHIQDIKKVLNETKKDFTNTWSDSILNPSEKESTEKTKPHSNKKN